MTDNNITIEQAREAANRFMDTQEAITAKKQTLSDHDTQLDAKLEQLQAFYAAQFPEGTPPQVGDSVVVTARFALQKLAHPREQIVVIKRTGGGGGMEDSQDPWEPGKCGADCGKNGL